MFKILVVDDEEKIREVIKTYAEFEGHTVVEAIDGIDAVEHPSPHALSKRRGIR